VVTWLTETCSVRAAAEQVMAALRAGTVSPSVPTSVLYGSDGGKMFGTLVVRAADGRTGFLKAFSGQLDRTWDVEGFVPPVFNREARAAIEPRGEASVRSFTARVVAARNCEQWARARAEQAQLAARHEREEAALSEAHHERRAFRQAARARPGADSMALNAAARADEVEHRAMKTRMREERAPLELALAGFERRLRRIERHRVAASRIVSWQLYDSYVFENASGQTRTLRALFAPRAPPSGAGDCAAPKLLIHAQRHGLQPLSLAEFWWGLPPRGGGRVEGAFYPPCVEKCGTLLPFLLVGSLAPVSWEPG
jgi:tRNA pseudouridine32 synthase/23S rRNA pseudouridine746 synthase